MLNRKYYKVKLSTIDYDKTIGLIDEMKSSKILDIINNSIITDLGSVIVYKTVFGNFKEFITGKPIAAITEELVPYSDREHDYSMTIKSPVFFKCNTSMCDDSYKNYPTLDSMIVESDEIEKYLIEHLGTDKSEQKYKVYEFLSDLYTYESNAKNKYAQLLDYYGLAKRKKSKEKSEKEKIKLLRNKFDI